MDEVKTYRCTRDKPYKSQHSIGHTDLTARQGHYIEATSEADALATMAESFKEDVEEGYGFTIDKSWTGYTVHMGTEVYDGNG